jgi:hypothetical protein
MNAAIGIDHTQRLGQLQIGQIEQRFITAAAPLADTAAETFELQRVEVLPDGAGDDLRRRIKLSPTR